MRTFLRVAFWSLPVVLTFLASGASVCVLEEISLTRACMLLTEGGVDQAQAVFGSHSGSIWHRRWARAGLAICRAMSGLEADPAQAPPAGAPLSLSLLLRQQLRAGRPAGCLRLAELALRWRLDAGRVYAAAAALELSQTQRAAAELASLAPERRGSLLARRAEQALALVDAGAQTLVRDRSGRLLGHLDADGNFHLSELADQALLPAALIDELQELQSPGPGLRASIDLELAALARDALAGYQGSIVLLDPASGEVLAAVSDDRSLARLRTPSFQQMLEPASIMKLITTVGALRAGIDPDRFISGMRCGGAYRFRGGILYCPSNCGELSGLREAFARSCNVAFARLGVEIGREALTAELRRWRFDSAGGNPFPMGRIVQPQGNERQLADMAIGLEATSTSVLHAALMAAPVATDGVMPEPTLWHGADGLLGLSPRRSAPAPGATLLAPEWLPLLRRAMIAVTRWGGTAAWIAPPGFEVAMKTGTGGNGRDGFHVNYIGYGPLPRPRLAFCVRVTGQRTSPRVRRAAFEVTGALLRSLEGIAASRGWDR